jgi:hypothetical protein
MAFPEAESVLTTLPDRIDRAVVREAARHAAHGERDARDAFTVTMVWGYGNRGYGRWRTRRVLNGTPHAAQHLATVASVLADAGALDAYASFTGLCRLFGFGSAFGTKYLHFCPQSVDGAEALILDGVVGRWLRSEAGVHLNVASWSPRTYGQYLNTLAAWARELDVPAPVLEERIFTAGVTTWPG